MDQKTHQDEINHRSDYTSKMEDGRIHRKKIAEVKGGLICIQWVENIKDAERKRIDE